MRVLLLFWFCGVTGKNYLDQLKLITRTMGRPNPEDLDFIRKERAKSFMLTLPPASGNKFFDKFKVRCGRMVVLRSVACCSLNLTLRLWSHRTTTLKLCASCTAC